MTSVSQNNDVTDFPIYDTVFNTDLADVVEPKETTKQCHESTMVSQNNALTDSAASNAVGTTGSKDVIEPQGPTYQPFEDELHKLTREQLNLLTVAELKSCFLEYGITYTDCQSVEEKQMRATVWTAACKQRESIKLGVEVSELSP